MRPDLAAHAPFSANFIVHTLASDIGDKYTAHKLEALWTNKKRALYPDGYVAIAAHPYASGRLHGLKKHGVYVNPRAQPPLHPL
jgi:hypothetical protein